MSDPRTDSGALQQLLAVETSREKHASGRLQDAQEEQERLLQQLNQLQDYRRSYESRLAANRDKTLDPQTLADYRIFLANLNRAAEAQSERVEQNLEGVERLREQWLELNKGKRSVERLIEERTSAKAVKEEKAQNTIDQDQFAARYRSIGDTY